MFDDSVIGNLPWKQMWVNVVVVLFPKFPGGICHVTMMCGFMTMHWVQNRLVDEQLEHIHNQSSYNDFGCYSAYFKTLELRPASTHEMTGKTRICVMDPRDAPAREFETLRQRLKATPPYVVKMQHDDDSINDEALKTLCTDQANQGG